MIEAHKLWWVFRIQDGRNNFSSIPDSLDFWTPQKVFFGSFNKLWFLITILLKHLSLVNQAKENTLLNCMPFMVWWLFQQAQNSFCFPQISQICADSWHPLFLVPLLRQNNIHDKWIMSLFGPGEFSSSPEYYNFKMIEL